MGNSSFFRFGDDNKTKHIYSPNFTRYMGKLKTYSPTYYIMDNGENMLNYTRTLDIIYLTGILYVQCLQIRLHNDDNTINRFSPFQSTLNIPSIFNNTFIAVLSTGTPRICTHLKWKTDTGFRWSSATFQSGCYVFTFRNNVYGYLSVIDPHV